MLVWVLTDVQLSSDTGTVGVVSPVVDSVLPRAEDEGAVVVRVVDPQPDTNTAITAITAITATTMDDARRHPCRVVLKTLL